MTLPACDRIIELSEKAQPGPWTLSGEAMFLAVMSGDQDVVVGRVCATFNDRWEPSAAFIAEARTLAPKIALALNEAVRAIEEAEHATSCPWMPPLWRDQLKDCADMYNCTCWKQTALARINELLK